MAMFLLMGGITGSAAGVQLFAWLRQVGQVELVVSLSFVLVLGTIGSLVLTEALRMLTRDSSTVRRSKLHQHMWLHALPLKMRFRKSRLYISVLPPIAIGCFAGLMAAIMGIGGGFILVPAMIFLLGMPTLLAVGTSLFHVFVVNIGVTIMHAYTNQTVDVLLALLIGIGGITGAQLGARIGPMLKAEQLRGLFGLVVLAVAIKVTVDLTVEPDDLFSLTNLRG
jgi:uncharacterized membrane protein YfcA